MCFCLTWLASAEQAAGAATGEVASATVATPMPDPVDLSAGSRGDAVLRMQQRLSILGFFYTAEDGIYGANTQSAVKAFEEYLRLLESDEIERIMAEEAAAQTPTPVTIPTRGAEIVEPGATTAAQPTGETTAVSPTVTPVPTPDPTPEPTPAPTPSTVADGIAEVAVLEILFADADGLYRRDAQLSDQGLDVTRIQRRLVALNYLNDEPDGRFGVNTQNAVKAFQQAHDMNATGVADRAMQQILFSEDAVVSEKPVYNQLYLGVSGEDVKAVQQQLRQLGFMNAKASGTFDASTEEAVKQLEIYLHQLEVSGEQSPAATMNALTSIQPSVTISADHPNETPDPENTIAPSQTPAGEEQTASAKPQNSLLVGQIANGQANTNGNATGASGSAPVNPSQSQTGDSTLIADGFVPTGVVTAEMQIRLLEEGIPVYLQNAKAGDVSVTVWRVQRRLYALEYLLTSGVDGIFGNGTQNAVLSFQRRNNLPETGVADQATQAVLFSEDAVKAIKPYLIKVSTDDQRVYVYTHDVNDEYNILVKDFICSTGLKDTPTPKGTFTNTGRGARWHYFKKYGCWAQYAYYIDGDIMFHSVLFSDNDESTLNQTSVKRLGKRASHGCVRLRVEDAKWIWENCAAGTKVVVY